MHLISYMLLLVWILVLCTAEEKTWLFAVGGNRRPFNFIDEETGILRGADLDLINAVCRIANQKCTVTVQPFEECIRTLRGRFYPGEGLMAGWFDACTSYVTSIDRVNSCDFTDPVRTSNSKFAVQKGNPKRFDPENISQFVITHLNGAYTNQQCLTRIGLGKAKRIIVASGINEAKALMLNGTADALFSPRTSFSELEVLPESYKCDVNGVGMMVKKGSELPLWWNPAFKKYYMSGEYTEMCNQINIKYGGFPVKTCLPPPYFTKTDTQQLKKNMNVLKFSIN